MDNDGPFSSRNDYLQWEIFIVLKPLYNDELDMTYTCDNDVIVEPCSPGILCNTVGTVCPWVPAKLKFKMYA